MRSNGQAFKAGRSIVKEEEGIFDVRGLRFDVTRRKGWSLRKLEGKRGN
jgi:hypothetical protein